MKPNWEDLPKKLNVWTVRNTVMEDINTGEIIQHYSTNTHLRMFQKTHFRGETWYRTESTANRGLDWAFKASSFGLPNEKAPSVHKDFFEETLAPKVSNSAQKEKHSFESLKSSAPAKDGEAGLNLGFFKKFFRKKHD